jgi:hypothetical protein
MIVAAGIAVMLGVGRCMEQRAHYLGQASVNASMEALYRIGSNGKLEYDSARHPFVFIFKHIFNEDDTLKPEYVNRVKVQHAYFEGLVRKYRYGASHPWLSLEPDPPRPRW